MLEVSLVAGLTSFLVLMVSSTWTAFGRSMSDAIIRSKVAQGANLALATLQRDLGGYLPEQEAGGLEVGKFAGRLIVSDEQLLLFFDGAPTNDTVDWVAPDRIIRYHVVSDELMRTDDGTGASTLLAHHVSQIQVTDVGGGAEIALTLTFRDIERQYLITSRDP